MRALALLLLAACAAPPLKGMQRDDVLAVMPDSTPQGRDALVRAMDQALGAQVMLADDAFAAASQLEIERRHREGRDYGEPEQFVLVKNGSQCILIHQRTQKRYPLPGTTCVEGR